MLKLAGEFEVGQEKIELLSYSPGVKDTGDLEAATKTITATTEATGLGNADYSASLTLPKPSDARLAVKSICARLSVNIAGLGTATHVYCRVYVDAQDADHKLFDEDWTSAGAKLDAVDKTSGTIFDLLNGGNAHTFYFFFWADVTDQTTIDTAQLWEGVGTCATVWQDIIELQHKGLVWWNAQFARAGTGSPTHKGYVVTTFSSSSTFARWTGQVYEPDSGRIPLFLCPDKARIHGFGSVATDLNYISNTIAVIRSEE